MASKDTMGLLLMGKPKAGEPDDMDESDGGDTGEISAASAAIKAIKAGDATALSEALKLHYELCQTPAYTDSEE